MKIFLDTANIEHIKEIAAWGILKGVTTNPSLIAKETGKDFQTIIQEICKIVDGPISAEVTSNKAKEMISEARKISQWHKNITIKIPICPEGLKAISVLSKENISTNATLCFSANQALLVAEAGATFVSPFLGRVDDMGQDGLFLLEEIVTLYENYAIPTEIIAASIRHPQHIIQAAIIGSDIATIPYPVIKKMVKHPLTTKGIEKFNADWEKYSKE